MGPLTSLSHLHSREARAALSLPHLSSFSCALLSIIYALGFFFIWVWLLRSRFFYIMLPSVSPVLFSFHALNLCIFPQFMFSHSVLYDLSLIWSLSFLDLCLSSLTLFVSALLEKQSKFPRYNMKCRGKRDTTWNIPRSITFSPVHFMLYHRKSAIRSIITNVVNRVAGPNFFSSVPT